MTSKMDILQQIISLRMQSHLLLSPMKKPHEMISHMGALQAQDILQVLRNAGSRIDHSIKDTIKKSLTQGEIIRTRPMRGTLHYLAPENVHRMLDLCASKTLPGFAKRRAFLGLSDSDSEKSLDIIASVLKKKKILTRSELGEALKAGGMPMQTQRVYHLACYAATRGLICFGPATEKEETFVLLDQRVPKQKKLTRDEQLAKLAALYMTGHGPATVDDLARWSGLGKTDCKKGILSIQDSLHTIEYENKIYYYNKNIGPQKQKSSVLLLGGFDEYFLGYKDRSIVADMEHHGKLFTSNGIFFPTILVDGRVVGTWKRIWKKDTVHITCSALPGIKLPMDEIYEQGEKYREFWGGKKHIII